MTRPPDPFSSTSGLRRSGRAATTTLLERDFDGVTVAYRPVADLRRGDVRSFEAVLGAQDVAPRSPAAWSAHGTATHTGVVEARVLEVLLESRTSLPHGASLVFTVSASALTTGAVQHVLSAAGALDDVLLSVLDSDRADDFAIASAVEAARDMGLRIAIDAGDAGRAELERVVRLHPEVIRIDGCLSHCVADDLARCAAVSAVVSLAAKIEADVLASDVVREIDLRALAPLGVRYATGAVIGSPAVGMCSAGHGVEALVAALAPDPPAEPAVARLVESPIALPVETSLPDLVDTLLVDARNDFLPLVDDDHRPVALVERAAVLRGESYERAVTWVVPDAAAAPVARRAMERPPLERFTPLVCCDSSGRYIGLVRIERLVSALAR